MKVVDFRATPVTVPAEAPWRWSMGIETGTTRTILELITDEGITGIGETYGGARTLEALETAKPFVRRDRSLRDGPPPAPPGRVRDQLRDQRAAVRPIRHRDGVHGRRGQGARSSGRVAARGCRARPGRGRQLPLLPVRVRGRQAARRRLGRGDPRPGERAPGAQRTPGPQAQGRRADAQGGVPRPRAAARPLPGRPAGLGSQRRLVGGDDDPCWPPPAPRRVRAPVARGPDQLAGGHVPGAPVGGDPVRDQHVPDRTRPARARDPRTLGGRDPGRRPLLGRVPGQPEDGRGLRSLQPRRRHAQRP